MSTLHCALENGADLLNECQKIRHYRARSTEERRRRMPNSDFFYSASIIIVMLYTHSIGNQL